MTDFLLGMLGLALLVTAFVILYSFGVPVWAAIVVVLAAQTYTLLADRVRRKS